jgi:dienelactone hydrolase
MGPPIDFEPPANEPSAIFRSAATELEDPPKAELQELEFSCRGDRVRCTLVSPEPSGPAPLVLLVPERLCPTAPAIPEQTRAWVESGCAVASVDLPLHGVRKSAKLSRQLAASMQAAARGEQIDESSKLLWCEFTRQAVLELRRTLDVLAGLPSLDGDRVAFAGFGVGGFVGALLCAVDSRPRAAVIASTGGGFAPEEIDPARYVGRVAPRPVLLLNDEKPTPRPFGIGVRKRSAKLLHDAAHEPKRIVWSADASQDLTTAWEFLAPLLGL